MENQTTQDEKFHAYNNLIEEGKNLEEILAMLERTKSKVIKSKINQLFKLFNNNINQTKS